MINIGDLVTPTGNDWYLGGRKIEGPTKGKTYTVIGKKVFLKHPYNGEVGLRLAGFPKHFYHSRFFTKAPPAKEVEQVREKIAA